MQVHPNDPKSPAFTFQTALRLVYRIQTACEAARVDEKNFPCRSASLPGDTPTSAATLLRLSATGVDGPDFPCRKAEASDVAMLVNVSFIASDVA